MSLDDQNALLEAVLNILPSATVRGSAQCVKVYDGRAIGEIHTENIRRLMELETKKMKRL
jgi:hypothetical protein